MFTKKTSVEKTGLERAIDQVLVEMSTTTPDTDDYAKMVSQLETLYKIKDIDKPDRVSSDTLAIIAGNLVGIVMIVGYERTNVVTSKALAFMMKLR